MTGYQVILLVFLRTSRLTPSLGFLQGLYHLPSLLSSSYLQRLSSSYLGYLWGVSSMLYKIGYHFLLQLISTHAPIPLPCPSNGALLIHVAHSLCIGYCLSFTINFQRVGFFRDYHRFLEGNRHTISTQIYLCNWCEIYWGSFNRA